MRLRSHLMPHLLTSICVLQSSLKDGVKLSNRYRFPFLLLCGEGPLKPGAAVPYDGSRTLMCRVRFRDQTSLRGYRHPIVLDPRSSTLTQDAHQRPMPPVSSG